MVFDGENIFMLKRTMTGTEVMSDIVANSNGGDAYNSLWLFVGVNKDLSGGPATIELLTADSEKMTGAKIIGTYKVEAKKGAKVMAKLPLGVKAYLQVKVSGQTFTAGEVTAALVSDVALK